MIELAALNAVACAEDCGIPLNSPAGALEFVCVALKKSVALKIMRVPLKIPLRALNTGPAPLVTVPTALRPEACAEDCGIPLKCPAGALLLVCVAMSKFRARTIARVPIR